MAPFDGFAFRGTEKGMLRNLALVMVAFSLSAVASAEASQYGTADEAKTMLDRAIAAVKETRRRRWTCSAREREVSGLFSGQMSQLSSLNESERWVFS